LTQLHLLFVTINTSNTANQSMNQPTLLSDNITFISDTMTKPL